MKIEKLEITNIRSFKVATPFSFHDDFNILIGPNGSGKSNLLDIITIIIRKYFLFAYQIIEQNENSGFFKIIQKNEVFQDINRDLAKFFKCIEDRVVKIEFKITIEDILNIKKVKENYDFISDETQKYRNSPNYLLSSIELWNLADFTEDKIVAYKIIENSVSYDTANNTCLSFLQYLNMFEYLVLLTNGDEEKRLNPNYLFFGPYRSGDFQNLQATLSSQSFSQAFQSAVIATSRTNLSLINIASLYFAEKRRRFEDSAENEGYRIKWDSDTEVQLVTKYLKLIGYSWDLKLIDKNKNIYEIILYKDGKDFLISQASSGEKEILNFLLGIFAINMKNGIVIIDEPELHLHPRWQNTLMDLFIELSLVTKNQFIISTHSAIFINSRTYNHIFRIYKNDENISQMVELKDIGELKIKDILHIINSTNNEKIFFADKVIMVEGITDYLIFSKIIEELTRFSKGKQIIEIIEIKGKTNQTKFNTFLNAIGVISFFISDLDYVHNIGGEELKSLFIYNERKLIEDVLKNPKSKDYLSLIEAIDDTILKKDYSKLNELWEYIKSMRVKIRPSLTSEEKTKLSKFIERQKEKNIYILSDGDIEEYFPIGFRTKDLDNVFKLLSEEYFASWKKEVCYNRLESMIKEIIEKL